jgi:hypothetical protein
MAWHSSEPRVYRRGCSSLLSGRLYSKYHRNVSDILSDDCLPCPGHLRLQHRPDRIALGQELQKQNVGGDENA